MTPAVVLLQNHAIPHQVLEYSHDPGSASYGQEAADKLGVPAQQVFKTLVAELDSQQLVVAIVPVTTTLSLKQLAKAASGKKASMADKTKVQRSTGYVLGGVSPLAQKKPLKTFIDEQAFTYTTIYVSGGKRGVELAINPQDLARVLNAKFVAITQA